MAGQASVEDRIDELFRGDPDEFVAKRDALVKALKAEGDKDGANEVKGLRRPTLAAWAVNQLTRTNANELERLVVIGERLREAHEALLDGKDEANADIRRATNDRRTLVGELADKAVGLLGASGQRDAIEDTLDAAVADPEAAAAVRAGRLSKELAAPSGFGGGDLASVFASAPPAKRSARPGKAGATRAAKASATDDDADEQEERERREREERIAELRRIAEERAADADEATRKADAAHEEVDRIQALLDEAEAAARSADTDARRARKAAEQAKKDLDRADA